MIQLLDVTILRLEYELEKKRS